jgi:DNA-3-methyladenine glycosylase
VNPLPRDFYRRDPRVVAPELLNKRLVRADGRSGRIVETEAYCGGEDPASHAYRGPTARNGVMFGPPGHLYVYFTYGMHWCCNPVCGDDGEGVAVLLRALEPVSGLERMREMRGPKIRRDRDLCNGPAKLCEALSITGVDNGVDLVVGEEAGVWLADDGVAPPARPERGPRVGISRAVDQPWRWWVPDNPNVSRR